MRSFYRAEGPKRPVNLSLNGDLLRLGKELGINISSVAEEALAYSVAAHLEARWREENREATAAYNHRVETRGVFSDGLRSF